MAANVARGTIVGQIKIDSPRSAAPAGNVLTVRIERHWWNGQSGQRRQRDVFIRTDGQRWEVEARMGGEAGRSTVHQCPGLASAEILADAWMGGQRGWQAVVGEAAQPRPGAQRTRPGETQH
jgi:hypothetical protein